MDNQLLVDIIMIINDKVIQKFLIGVIVTYIADFVTGFSRAWSKNNIKSNKLRHGIVKFIQYVAFISIGILLDFLFGNKGFTIVFCITVMCIEIRSLIENTSENSMKQVLTKVLGIFTKETEKYKLPELEDTNKDEEKENIE